MDNSQKLWVEIDAEAYQPLIDRLIVKVGADASKEDDLRQYFITAIRKGTDLSQIDLPTLNHLSPAQLVNAAQKLPDKLSLSSREKFSAIGEMRKSKEWDNLFPDGKYDAILDLSSDTKNTKTIDEKIGDYISKYNDSAEKKIRQSEVDKDKFEIYLPNRDGSKYNWRTMQGSLIDFIKRQPNTKEKWLILDDYETFISRQSKKPKELQNDLFIDDLLNNKLPNQYDYLPENFRVVFSRDPQKIAEMSSGQKWHSCTAEGRENFRYIDKDIQEGTLVAYLVHKDDVQARYPLARQLIKPYQNLTDETILVPAKVYGYTESNNINKLLAKTVEDFVSEFNQGKNGRFTMNHNLYADGQVGYVVVGEGLSKERVHNALDNYYRNQFQELLVELNKHQDNENKVKSICKKIARLRAAKTLSYDCFRELRQSHIEEVLPSPEDIIEVAKESEFDYSISTSSLNEPTKKEIIESINSHEICLDSLSLTLKNDAEAGNVESILSKLNKPINLYLSGTGYQHDQQRYDITSEKAIAIANSPNLTRLKFHNICMSQQVVIDMFEAIKNNKNLTNLSFDEYAKINDEGIKGIFEALKQNDTITSLCFDEGSYISYKFGITDKGLSYIGDFLKTNNSITDLELQHCSQATDNGMQKILDSIQDNKNIIHLWFYNMDYFGKDKTTLRDICEKCQKNKQEAEVLLSKIMDNEIKPLENCDVREIKERKAAILAVLKEKDQYIGVGQYMPNSERQGIKEKIIQIADSHKETEFSPIKFPKMNSLKYQRGGGFTIGNGTGKHNTKSLDGLRIV